MTLVTSKNLKFPNDQKLIQKKNVMISDSGATCDSTPNEAVIKLIRNGKAGNSITNASGDDMAAKYVVNMHVINCNNKGEVVNELFV